MTESDLEKEVREIIRRRVDSGQVAAATWLTQNIVGQHEDIEGSDAEWYQLCAYAHIRSVVRRCVQQYKESPEMVDQQMLLSDMFKRVQKAYCIEREKEQVVVPIGLLSGDELDSKIESLRKMGDGCYEHADELIRYKNQRQLAA